MSTPALARIVLVMPARLVLPEMLLPKRHVQLPGEMLKTVDAGAGDAAAGDAGA